MLSKRPVNNLSFLERTKEHRYTCIYTPNDKFDNCNYYTLTLYTMYMKCQIDVHVLNYLENYLIKRELSF